MNGVIILDTPDAVEQAIIDNHAFIKSMDKRMDKLARDFNTKHTPFGTPYIEPLTFSGGRCITLYLDTVNCVVLGYTYKDYDCNTYCYVDGLEVEYESNEFSFSENGFNEAVDKFNSLCKEYLKLWQLH